MKGGSGKIEETADQQALAEVAAARYNRYTSAFIPLENDYIKRVFATRSPAAYDEAQSIATAAAAPQVDAAVEARSRELLSGMGVNPNSGVFKSPALNKAAARMVSDVATGGDIGNRNRFYQGVQGVISMGQGQAGTAMEGLGTVSGAAGQRAAESAKSSFGTRSGYGTLAGTLVGAGTGVWANTQPADKQTGG